jgi:4-methylaminobutanoate oxidase (formaldehyde-forming)
MADLPAQARIVVIGGGVVGASVAYHLAALGCADTVLLERAQIGSGTSWHAAGNMETYRADPLIGEMIRYAVDFYPRLEAETGQALGWRQTGRVMFTHDAERMRQFRGLPALGRARGIDIELLSPRGVQEKLPIIGPDGLAGGIWIPSDGRINPTDLANAMARGARQRGARVVEGMPVTGIAIRRGRVAGVITAAGEIACETVVCAAGLWSPQLGALAGVRIPLCAAQHFYLLTKPLPEVHRDLPLFLGYDERLYGREDVGGLLVGFFDSDALPVGPEQLPRDFAFGLLDENWSQVEANVAIATRRFPVLERAEIRMLLNGPESFTPDMQMLLGEAPELPGFFLATGMNSSGIALSAAAGRLTAEWILEGAPSLDAARLDIKRFAPGQSQRRYVRERTREVPSFMCERSRPGLDFRSSRNVRRSSLHGALLAAGAVMGSAAGWERPLWFAAGETPAAACVRAELAAATGGAALFDRSSDAKLWLEGPGAGRLLRRLTGAAGDVAPGEARLAPMLNAQGGVEALPTLLRLAAESWLLLAEPEQGTRLEAWVRRHIPPGEAVLVDVTGGWSVLALAGPGAAALLAAAGEPGQPAGGGRPGEIEIGFATARRFACPVTGQTCLLLPAEYAAGAHEALLAAGIAFRPAGFLAAEALRIGRGVARLGLEASPGIAAVEAGLDAGLDLQGNGDFLGRPAVLAQRATRPARRVAAFRLPGDAEGPFTHAPLLDGGRSVGFVTSGAPLPGGGSVLLGLIERTAGDCTLLWGGERVALEGYAPALR